MGKSDQQLAMWNLEGRFLGFVFEDGKPKHFKLMTADGERRIKLAKELRASMSQFLNPGDWIQVGGEMKVGHKLEMPKLKAYKIIKSAPSQVEQAPPVTPQQPKAKKPAAGATILVCQKSDCVKRGSREVCQALETALSDRNIPDVTIRSIGCMKHCKAGPNLVFMPEKTRYSRVSNRDATTLIDEHFPCSSPQESKECSHSPSAAT